MLHLVAKLNKLYTKTENRHYHEAFSDSLQTFQSHLSNCLNHLSLNSKSGSEILSFSWIRQCFELLPITHKAFAKLAVDIDYPMSKWEAASVEEYLRYSLNLLELFNSISSSLALLGQARLSISHALSLVENSLPLAVEHLKAIQAKSFSKDFKGPKKESEERLCSGKELVIHQALTVMQSIGFWVCAIVLSALCGDAKPYLDMRNSAGGFVNSPLIGLDSSICAVLREKRGVLREVKELNDAVARLVAAPVIGNNMVPADELQRRLEVFEKQLEGLGMEVDHLFSEVLAGRNELLNGLRQQKQ